MIEQKIIQYTGFSVRNIKVDTTFSKSGNVADLKIF